MDDVAQDDDWRLRESAILALGAISEGCHRGLIPYIGELVRPHAPLCSRAGEPLHVRLQPGIPG